MGNTVAKDPLVGNDLARHGLGEVGFGRGKRQRVMVGGCGWLSGGIDRYAKRQARESNSVCVVQLLAYDPFAVDVGPFDAVQVCYVDGVRGNVDDTVPA